MSDDANVHRPHGRSLIRSDVKIIVLDTATILEPALDRIKPRGQGELYRRTIAAAAHTMPEHDLERGLSRLAAWMTEETDEE